MTSAARTVLLFGAPSLFLTLWQYWRSAALCHDGSGWSTALWGAQLLVCGLSLVAVRSAVVSGTPQETTALRMLLLACVPTMLALRLAELCHNAH